MAIEHSPVQLTKADFTSDQMVKWCPGCGDHAILASVLGIFPEIGYKKENFCVVSGIGCSSRFPYYVNTYGFHGIHGRAAAIATGVKIANPHLSVWINSGDGDATAIGGNHFIHVIRRNMDVNYILFNNRIYGLTKGQYSPTTKQGQVTKTSPFGVIDYPFNPGELVIGSRGTFFARAIDNSPKTLGEVCRAMAAHDGAAIVEVLQNCVIFNDKTHAEVTDRELKEERQLWLEQGKPMIFGKNKDKGLILKGNHLEVVEIGKDGITEADILVHDATRENTGVHMMLAQLCPPEFPMAFGVIRAVKQPTYNQLFEQQMEEVKATSKIKCMDDLLNSGETWEIK
ncbi:MAG: 2-oxoacid:ferredoxin oxidoreductase subunit beta [Bacteroidales bacterium]|nr:2-oxoacid:ferredoxin oxidoreductase subunit beta [Bacteroidales bacterium]MDD4002211.1 2-oxoacid:ferredoxin oxidoreductase subunit beta [Bacteroidales bacterium]MDD4528958.1 2-oxoacid:ferredoxin oxidoreductase subunit beta [Bacteroidales bacterium]MDD4830160.1 2-oxoacid:ferredoxin oxidoreductase subunit beta [Bacteroidales bacterium]